MCVPNKLSKLCHESDTNVCHGKVNPNIGKAWVFNETGPLACLSLFPVANVDKVSWD